jgi:HK97 gp10 family phage protein
VRIQITGVEKAINAFNQLPIRMQFKHMRIALNAAAGVIRDRAAAIAPRDTNILSRSLGVKVKIPNASFNPKHWGKPEYAVIGAKRRFAKYAGTTASGTAISLSARGAAGRMLKGQRVVLKKPSRYLHLVEKGTPHSMEQPFLDTAVRTEGDVAASKAIKKLEQGLQQEAAALSAGR